MSSEQPSITCCVTAGGHVLPGIMSVLAGTALTCLCIADVSADSVAGDKKRNDNKDPVTLRSKCTEWFCFSLHILNLQSCWRWFPPLDSGWIIMHTRPLPHCLASIQPPSTDPAVVLPVPPRFILLKQFLLLMDKTCGVVKSSSRVVQIRPHAAKHAVLHRH